MAQKGCKKSPQEVQVYFIRLVHCAEKNGKSCEIGLGKMEKVVKSALKKMEKVVKKR